LHLKVDLMPEEYVTKKIISAFKDYESLENLRICLLRAQVANPELPKALEEAGAIVDDVACYKTVPETEDRYGTAARFLEVGANWITFTSSSTVENFHARFDLLKLLQRYPDTKLASIGPETSKAIVTLGLKPTVEAREHTIPGLVAALQGRVKRDHT
jgi:uroporphyrinogen III methyltransferase/synthase